MATLAFKPYTYVPTPPRSKSTATRRRPAPEQVSILDKLQQIRSSSASLSTPRPVAAAAAMPVADGNGGYKPGIRGTSTVYGGSDKENDDEINDDGRDLPTVEKLLLTKLQEQGFAAADPNPGHKERGVEEAAADERAGAIDRHGSVPGGNFGGSPDPMVLQGDGDSSASEAEVNDNILRAESAAAPGAGLFDSPETAIDSITLAPPCSSDGWHVIDDFPETAPHLPLAEQGASTSKPTHPHTPSSRLSSEPLHDSISTEGSRHARSEATNPSSSLPPRYYRVSPETQLSQEGHLHTGRDVADEHELVDHALNTLLVDEWAREQQEVNGVAPAVTAERAGGSPRLANGRQSLPNLDPTPEPSHNEAGSRSGRDSDDELNSSDSPEDNEKKPCPAKRKQPSSSHGGPARKKRRRPLQQSPPRQRRPLSEPHRQYPKSHSPLNQRPRVATSSSAESRLPSPAPSMPQSIDITMPLDDSSPGRSSGATPPTLTEITFRPHSAHCYSFTAVVRDGCDGRGVSLTQVVRLIASTGHVGKIDDFTIKPKEQQSYLLTGFSRHASSRPSSGGTTVSTAAEAGRDHVDATRTRRQEGRPVDARTLTSRGSKPSISDNDGGLTDSDSESSSGDDGCSSEGEQGRSSMSKHSRWSDLDEQRLLAWKKEGKSWDWIFKKFKDRTRPAIRTRWNMIRPRGE
ncbi:hypothetical protein F5882DRAFT_110926 [Hyaloscypha sp. PMI_1271]|nr:hypothetical protein F5882DRAFT_110926 [Hyaloscypha sp. PMI_1271]